MLAELCLNLAAGAAGTDACRVAAKARRSRLEMIRRTRKIISSSGANRLRQDTLILLGYYPAFWVWAFNAETETKRLPGKLSSRRRVASTVWARSAPKARWLPSCSRTTSARQDLSPGAIFPKMKSGESAFQSSLETDHMTVVSPWVRAVLSTLGRRPPKGGRKSLGVI